MRTVFCLFLFALGAALLTTCGNSPNESRDTIAPACIVSLTVTDSTATTVALSWLAVGDDSLTGKASAYDLRISRQAIDNHTWDGASVVPQNLLPGTQGLVEHYTITGLDSGKAFFAAIKAVDDAGNWSALSNVVAMNVPDTVPPASVSDLAGHQIDDTLFAIQWTAPGGDSLAGRASRYEIRYAREALTESNWAQSTVLGQHITPASAGHPELMTFTWPWPDTAVNIGLKTFDNHGNTSALSNIVRLIWLPRVVVEWQVALSSRVFVPKSVVQTADCGIVVASDMFSGYGKSEAIAVTKFDAAGQQLWEHEFGGAGLETAGDVIALDDGRIIVFGSTTSFADSTGDMYLLVVSSTGYMLREKAMDVTHQEEVSGAALCPDGGYVIAGSGVEATSLFAQVVKLDAMGNEQWHDFVISYNSCPYDPPPAYARAFDVAVGAGGIIAASVDLYFWDQFGVATCWGEQWNIYLRSHSLNGTQGWSNHLESDLWGGGYSGHVISTLQGDFISTSVTSGGAALHRVSPAGSSQWQLPLVGFQNGMHPDFCNLGQDHIAVAGNTNKTASGASYASARLNVRIIDTNGQVEHESTLPGSGDNSVCQCVAALADSSFVVVWKQSGQTSSLLTRLRLVR